MSTRSSLLSPLKSFRLFLERLQYRDKAQPAPILLERHRIYIVPTRSGFVFALMMFAMLIGALNYNNSLAYLLTFLLTGVGFVAMIHTFQNLFKLTLHIGHTQAVFCGEALHFPLIIENHNNNIRRAITLYSETEVIHGIDIDANSNKTVLIQQPTTARGVQPLQRFTLQTTYPLGLFRAWSPVYVDSSAIVYPKPAPPGTPPPETVGHHGTRIQSGLGDDDFIGIRGYQKGDSLKHIDWKAAARGLPLMTKQYGSNVSEQLWLTWNSLPNLDTEQRLSQICRWILDSEKRGDTFGLDIPDYVLAPSRGESHRQQALLSLSLFGKRGARDD